MAAYGSLGLIMLLYAAEGYVDEEGADAEAIVDEATGLAV